MYMKNIIAYVVFICFLCISCQEEVPAHYRIEIFNETEDGDITFAIAGDTLYTSPGEIEVTQTEPGSQSWTMHIEFPNPPYIVDEVGSVDVDSHKRCTITGERGVYAYRWDDIE
jgi:hypothetical protein